MTNRSHKSIGGGWIDDDNDDDLRQNWQRINVTLYGETFIEWNDKMVQPGSLDPTKKGFYWKLWPKTRLADISKIAKRPDFHWRKNCNLYPTFLTCLAFSGRPFLKIFSFTGWADPRCYPPRILSAFPLCLFSKEAETYKRESVWGKSSVVQTSHLCLPKSSVSPIHL